MRESDAGNCRDNENEVHVGGDLKRRSELKLPLANQVAFLGKKGEREQRRKNYRCQREDGVDAWSHVKQSDDLSDLVDNIWQTRNQAKADGPHVDLRSAPKLK